MTFKFGLEKILTLRKEQVEVAYVKVEFTKKVINELKTLLIAERNRYFDDRDKLNDCVKNSSREDIPMYNSSLELAQKKMMEIIRTLRETQSELDLFERELIESKKNLKVLENLKEIKLEKYLKKEAVLEQKKLDEIVTRRFISQGDADEHD